MCLIFINKALFVPKIEIISLKKCLNAITLSLNIQKLSKSPKLYQSWSIAYQDLSPPLTTVHCEMHFCVRCETFCRSTQHVELQNHKGNLKHQTTCRINTLMPFTLSSMHTGIKIVSTRIFINRGPVTRDRTIAYDSWDFSCALGGRQMQQRR